MATLIVPVLNRYDKLDRCIASAFSGNVPVDNVIVIDNGSSYQDRGDPRITVFTPGMNIGVAKAWNYGILNSREVRIISNDDVEFEKDSIENILKFYNPDTINCSSGLGNINAFSLFTYPDCFLSSVGLFDELLSPNYAYFEDNDMVYRMTLLGLEVFKNVHVKCKHVQSASIAAFTSKQMEEHHKKFSLARSNYIAKWGGLPLEEKFLTPYGIT